MNSKFDSSTQTKISDMAYIFPPCQTNLQCERAPPKNGLRLRRPHQELLPLQLTTLEAMDAAIDLSDVSKALDLANIRFQLM